VQGKQETMFERDGLSKAELQRQVQALLPRAAGYAWTIVGNREDAEDAVQEAAMKAYLSRKNFDRNRPFKGWWFSILRNCCLDLLRRRRSRPAVPLVDGGELPARELPVRDEHEDLGQALEQLSASHREILELRYFGDCSYRDIAAVLGIPAGTVMSRLHSAREALAAILRKEGA
jgi:RNA polymerase sigma-70 factor (ECF subfamily)